MPDENITLLILNNVKRVRSIKVNRKRIRLAIITGISFMTVLFISLGTNFYLFQQNRGISAQLSDAMGRAEPGRQYDRNVAGGGDALPPVTASGAGERERTQEGSTNLRQQQEAEPNDIFANDVTSDQVSIDNLESTLSINGIELTVNFDVVKKDNVLDRVAGYIVVIGKTSDTKSPFICWPEKLSLSEDGTPANYLDGEWFSINWLRPTTARMLLSNSAERYQYFRIYIFSPEGDLMLLKTKTIPVRS